MATLNDIRGDFGQERRTVRDEGGKGQGSYLPMTYLRVSGESMPVYSEYVSYLS